MPNSTIHILTINAPPDDAEIIINNLRNAGMVIHAQAVNQDQEFIAALDNHDQDMALFFCGEEQIQLAHALTLCTNYRPELPFIIIYNQDTPEIPLTAMKQGARDIVSKDDHERLKLVVAREYGDLGIRRHLDKLKHQICESEKRYTMLVENSRDAIAYVHEGMHTHANPAYLSLFGFSTMGEIEGLPLMDMVTPEHQPKLKASLRPLGTSQNKPELEITCRHSSGRTFEAKLELLPASIDGESCTQIIIRDAQASRNPPLAPIKQHGETKAVAYKQSELNREYTKTDTRKLIKNALEYNRLHLLFQPIVSLRGDARENYATMVQLPNGSRMEVLSGHHLQDAGNEAQIVSLDRWAIKHAIEGLAQQRKEGRKVNFFISISRPSIKDNTLLLWICDCLRDAQAKGAWVTFQMNEEDLRTHKQEAEKLIDGLKKIKCQIAVTQISDPANIDHLFKQLPVDYLKLSPSLIENLAVSQEKQDSLYQLCDLLHTQNIKAIATGVEDASSLAILWSAGINYIQGYFLQGPSGVLSHSSG